MVSQFEVEGEADSIRHVVVEEQSTRLQRRERKTTILVDDDFSLTKLALEQITW